MRRTILLGTYAAHATRGPATMAFEARKHIAAFCAIERDITRRSRRFALRFEAPAVARDRKAEREINRSD
ncbi:MAG TPA: hypothetical protein VIH62_03140, partial [Xanthobacteraceae bacterium]